jgi:hypothetical protein
MDVGLAEILHGQTIDRGHPDDNAAPFAHCLRSGGGGNRTRVRGYRMGVESDRCLEARRDGARKQIWTRTREGAFFSR